MMKPDSLAPPFGVGHTTRFLRTKMAQQRAGELAVLKGRQACDVTAADLDQARSDLAPKPASIT